MSDEQNFGFEIDFLPVGDNSRSGDAICLRWGYNLCNNDTSRRQYVMVVDGGYADNGNDVVEHIKKYYGTTTIDVLVNTHPHADHVNGLETIVERCTINNLVMHRPWEHTGIKQSLKDGLEKAYSIATKAKNRGVSLCECFTSYKWKVYGVEVYVLNPTKEYYESLLPSFNVTPTEGEDDGARRIEFLEKMVLASKCPLTDDGETSAENNSGIVLAFKLPSSVGGIVMLTGDAGIPALENSVVEAIKQGLDLKEELKFFQVPHHGSIQNLGPTVLNSIFGLPYEAQNRIKTGYISVSKGHDKEHPAKHVINALEERGVNCYMTNGKIIQRRYGIVPERQGWVSLTKIGPYSLVEEVYVHK